MDITAVAFDFGGVLTGRPFVELERYAGELGLQPHDLTRFFRGHPKVTELELAVITTREFFKYVCIQVESEHGVRVDLHALARAAEAELTLGRINVTMLDMVAEISMGHRTVLLTNDVVEATWKDGFPFHLFNEVLDSIRVGLRKPDPRIYSLLLERLACRPDQVAFVDDFEENLVPAADLGMHTILFRDPAQCRSQLARLGVVRRRAPSSQWRDREC